MNAAPAPAKPITFETDVRPVLKANCFQCHGEGEKLKGDLDLRLRRTLLIGGESGPAIIPAHPEDSLLYQQIRNDEMPKGKRKLTAPQKELIRQWIATGAATARPEPEAPIKPGFHITEDERAFWSFQPVRRPEVPAVQHRERVRTPIDALLLHRLEERERSFAPEADKFTLVRRASLDLTGIPPTPEEVDLFLPDESPDAYDRLIDRLLASPRYGERWGRHWLDLAGYADSDGYVDADPVRRYAYKYRDYVIRSLNADKPFDQFVREQLAGDEMVKPPYTNLRPDQIEKLVATGFLRMCPDGTGAPDTTTARNAVVADTLKIVSTSLLGLSVGCAQCHDHRYDPVSQEDYYRLRAIFEPAYDWKAWRTPQARLISLSSDADRREAASIEAEAVKIDAQRNAKTEEVIAALFEKELAKVPAEQRDAVRAARGTTAAKRTAAQVKLLKDYPSVIVPVGAIKLYDPKAYAALQKFADQAQKIRAKKPVEDFIQALTEPVGAKVPVTYLFNRGDPEQPRQPVPPGELTVLCSSDSAPAVPPKDPALTTTGRRLAYAKHLTDGHHPLLSRVMVNRMWEHHFGRGIVATSADFGLQGERPVNPELLDWLADEFVQRGWSMKAIHKLIMTSTAYRQSSRRDANAAAIDPDNRLCGRMSVRRLEAESLRDSILAVSGTLNPRMFGPPLPVAEDESGQTIIGEDVRDGDGRQVPVAISDGQQFRRSIYIQVRRSKPLGILETFDAPTMTPNCEARTLSAATPQSLALMNGSFVLEQAKHLAQRVAKEADIDIRAQVARAWRLTNGREPSTEQLSQSMAFVSHEIERLTAKYAAAPPPEKSAKAVKEKPDPQLEALANFCHALLSANAFLYVD